MKLNKQKKIILAGAGLGAVALYMYTRPTDEAGAGVGGFGGGGFGGIPIPGESLGETGADGAGGVTYNFPEQPEPSFAGFEAMDGAKSTAGGLLAPPPSSQMIVPESKKIRIPDPYNIEKQVSEKITPTGAGKMVREGGGAAVKRGMTNPLFDVVIKNAPKLADFFGGVLGQDLGIEDRFKVDKPTPYRDIKKSPVPASLYPPRTGKEIGTIVGPKSPSKSPVAGSKKFVSKKEYEGKSHGVSYKQYTATGKSWTSMTHSERAKVRDVTRKIEGSGGRSTPSKKTTSKKSKTYRDGRGGHTSRPGSPD